MIHPGMFKTAKLPKYNEIDIVLNPWRLRSLLKELNPTHVHISVEGPLGIAARLLLARWKWRYTTAYHTNFPEYIDAHLGFPKSMVVPLIRWFHRRSCSVLVPSQTTVNKLKSWGVERSLTWGRGYNERVFYPKARRPGRTPGKQVLLYVGRVSHEKNIEAFLKLQNDNRVLYVVGDGPAREKLQKQFPLAMFEGYKQGCALAKYYRDADVFVFPSKSDTLGVVMIEAIACGTPVAAYKVEGPLDVVTPNINGILSNDLEDAVTKAASLDREVVAYSAHRFSWDASADTFENSLVTIK